VAIAAVALPFVNVAPNRLMSGEGALWQVWSFTPGWLAAALGAWVILSLWQGRPAQWLTLLLSEGLFILLFWSAGLAATHMASAESPLARTSIGSGLWLWLALCLLACSDAIRRLISSAVWRWVLNAQIWCIPLFLLFSGELNNLSLLKSTPTVRRCLMMPWRNT
jgi:osmoprotectant transport system permease protein